MIDNPLEILKKILSYSRKEGDCLLCSMDLTWQNRPRIKINGIKYNISRMIMHLCKDFPLDSDYLVLHNDNLCKSKACIEMNHLRIGTQNENMQDKVNKYGISPNFHGKFNGIYKTHCKWGHERISKNLTDNGSCKLCMLERSHKVGRFGA